LGEGLGVLAAFHRAGLVASNSEARRQIKAGGLRVNDVTIMDEELELTPKDLGPQGVIKLSLGKKPHRLIKPGGGARRREPVSWGRTAGRVGRQRSPGGALAGCEAVPDFAGAQSGLRRSRPLPGAVPILCPPFA